MIPSMRIEYLAFSSTLRTGAPVLKTTHLCLFCFWSPDPSREPKRSAMSRKNAISKMPLAFDSVGQLVIKLEQCNQLFVRGMWTATATNDYRDAYRTGLLDNMNRTIERFVRVWNKIVFSVPSIENQRQRWRERNRVRTVSYCHWIWFYLYTRIAWLLVSH